MKLKPLYTTFCWPTLMTVLGVSLLLGLGTWQLKRLEWKEHLIQTISDKLKENPQSLETLLSQSLERLETHEYQRITLTGTFLYEGEMKLRGRTYEGKVGYHLITPLLLASGAMVLVDRGWVPEEEKTPVVVRPEGPQEIKGIIRIPQKRRFFTPENNFEKNELYVIDPGEIAKVKKFTTLLPFYIISYSMRDEKGYPKVQGPVFQVSNFHLHYALTWYTLALALVVIYILYIRKKMKPGRKRKN